MIHLIIAFAAVADANSQHFTYRSGHKNTYLYCRPINIVDLMGITVVAQKHSYKSNLGEVPCLSHTDSIEVKRPMF